jgi:ATPase subunit of ABC transporter with duplicated ATPase domains
LESLIESSGLSVHPEAPMHAWSSGQKQRLQLSLALGTESPVVLLDEPASNLDAQGIAWLHEVIARVAALSTLVVATNDPAKEAPGQPEILEV